MALGWCGRPKAGSGTVAMPPPGYKSACRYQNTTGANLVIQRLGAIWDTAPGAGHAVKGFAYSDTAGAPDILIAVTEAAVGSIPASEFYFEFATPWVWPAGAWRWLGVICDDSLTATNQGTDTNGVAYNVNSYSSGPSNPFGSPTLGNFQYRLWVEGFDSAYKLGRISMDDGRDDGHPLGVYLENDPHFDKFTLGGAEAGMGGETTVLVTKMFVHYTNTNPTVKTHCSLYSGGGPYTPLGANLLGETNDVIGIVPGWQEYTFITPIELTAGDYWLGITSDDDACNCNVARFGGLLSTGGATYPSNPDYYLWPNPIPSPGAVYPVLYDQHPYGISIYALYAPISPPSVGGGGARSFVWAGDNMA